GQVAADVAVDEREVRGLSGIGRYARRSAVKGAAAQGIATVAAIGAGAAGRLIVADGGVGDDSGAAPFVGEAAAAGEAAGAADAAAPWGAPSPALGRVVHDGAVADGDGADKVDDPAAIAPVGVA